ncbi:restriction endonuclease subunit S [Azospirillum sp.]|uniref:restriction endonuclease subunit S n=1 Tax=Azospirillum sp. TaxID=34012 RepID=UPI002D360881|nr:restriction endonuclease subunit S [Azospirillum sp.]HYD70736.1 restriction endonuclease subunit S [Azospirillum sp.]
MSFPRYADYKDSGVEWLGEVPGHWTLTPIKALYRFVKRQDNVDAPVLSVYREYGVVQKSSRTDNNNKTPDDLSLYQTVLEGDLVVNKMKAWQGSLGISQFYGITSPDYAVFEKRHSEISGYLYNLLRSRAMPDVYRLISNGIRNEQWRLEPDKFLQIKIPLPPYIEQESITAFLDRETAKIDTLVAEQEKLIDLLKEKRQAVISHAVTKGLNPDAPMKDSGIEWLGEVPEHWEVVPVSYRYEVQLGKMLDSSKITGEHLRPYLRVFDVQWGKINIEDLPEMDFDEQDREKYRLFPGDLLVNEGGSYVGRSAVWLGDVEECYYQKALHRLRAQDSERDDSRFFFFVMENATRRGVFVAGGSQATIEHLTAEALRRYRFAFPPLDEQLSIVRALEQETIGIDALITEAQCAIDLLKERRSALISAAVTGKIDVRGVVEAEAAA